MFILHGSGWGYGRKGMWLHNWIHCIYCKYVQFTTDLFQPRTRATDENHCKLLHGPLLDHIATTYGLHRNSILNTSNYFHIVDGLAPDIMHDILEGSLQYDVKELLKYFIYVEKYFSLDLLNDRIHDFPYVLFDKVTKPATIAPSILA